MLFRSKQRSGYLYKKVAERLGFQVETVTTAALVYGHEMEPQAVLTYESMQHVETETVGFCTTDNGRYGASPDRLVDGGKGILQIKCAYVPWTQIAHFASPELESLKNEHYPQIQGEMLVTGAQWCDIVSYFPGLPLLCVRVERDPVYQRALEEALNLFCKDLDQLEKQLRAHPETVLEAA